MIIAEVLEQVMGKTGKKQSLFLTIFDTRKFNNSESTSTMVHFFN